MEDAFRVVIEQGVKDYGWLWLEANELATDSVRRRGINPSDPKIRTAMVLSVLAALKQVHHKFNGTKNPQKTCAALGEKVVRLSRSYMEHLIEHGVETVVVSADGSLRVLDKDGQKLYGTEPSQTACGVLESRGESFSEHQEIINEMIGDTGK
jgi:hypothetical protein